MSRKIPDYDIMFIKNGHNQARLRRQASGRRKGIIYFSNYYGLGAYMLSNNALRRSISRKAHELKMAITKELGVGKNGKDGHLIDTLVISKVVPGGNFKDRMTYEVYSTKPERYLPAMTQRENKILKAIKDISSVPG